MKWFYGKKTQLQKEIEKHHHQSYVSKEEGQQVSACVAPLLTQTRKITHHALLKSTPYSSCHKRSSTRTEPEQESSTVSSEFLRIRDLSKASSHKTESSSSNVKLSIASDQSTATGRHHGETGKEVKKEELHQIEPPEGEPMTEQRQKELEHYLKLKSAGWLQDRSGKWIKDENVEFDSDEDEPPPIAQT